MKWGGTILFVAILIVLGLTVGLKLYRSGPSLPASSTSTHQATPVPQTKSTPPSPPTPTTSPSAAATTPPSVAATPPAGPVTVTGDVEQTPYGPVQVAVTVAGTTITDVKELQAPNDRGRSIAINSYAAPILRSEVLKSQSGHVDTVSGATYTSEGYLQSVQSAIDRM